LTRATPGDLLAVQLDDRAGFLTRWQQLACRVLTPEAVSGRPNRAEFLQEIIRWSGRADTDSTGYRLVREFREATLRLSLTPIFAPCAAKDERFSWATFDIEPAVWALLEQKPAHLLAPDYADWDALLLAAVDATLEKLKVEKLTPAQARWGQYNRTAIRHPLSSALPGCLARFLDMPDAPQAGDRHMPRVAQPGFGASERLVVSPGAESEGILQTPAGQSGHPLSPFYQAGHEAWLRGEPTPLLPGPAQHRIVFTP
ncbi:MAG: penicillin acylase family protein, partial [Opitutaceae bacterium]|nr:penicillin acylase family protein [Opitutaceae bacterium]